MENAERKMELIRMMRLEQQENAGRMQKREQILYPDKLRNSVREDEMVRKHPNAKKDLFYLRLGISMGIFLLFLYMDTKNITFWGLTFDKIQTIVAETIDVNSFAFMEQFPYTLKE